jgi:hypothetical protein
MHTPRHSDLLRLLSGALCIQQSRFPGTKTPTIEEQDSSSIMALMGWFLLGFLASVRSELRALLL